MEILSITCPWHCQAAHVLHPRQVNVFTLRLIRRPWIGRFQMTCFFFCSLLCLLFSVMHVAVRTLPWPLFRSLASSLSTLFCTFCCEDFMPVVLSACSPLHEDPVSKPSLSRFVFICSATRAPHTFQCFAPAASVWAVFARKQQMPQRVRYSGMLSSLGCRTPTNPHSHGAASKPLSRGADLYGVGRCAAPDPTGFGQS